MKTIIVGGGKVGYYLLKTLYEHGHDVALIERNQDVCQRIAESIPVDVIHGDGTDLDVLRDAGIEEADIVAAVTGTDEENLIICKIAKLQYQISRTISRVNNPKNMEMFKVLGIDNTVCSTAVIANLIESEVDHPQVKILNTFDRGSMVLAEIIITSELTWAGKRIADIPFPVECVIVSVFRNDSIIYPKGDTQFQEGDKVLLVTSPSELQEFAQTMNKGRKKRWNLTKMN